MLTDKSNSLEYITARVVRSSPRTTPSSTNWSSVPPAPCDERVRLTPAEPFKKGAMWHRSRHPVQRGFDTRFTYQITNRSQVCQEKIEKDDTLTEIYRTCGSDEYQFLGEHYTSSINGGDGFAFVIQNHPDRTAALGRSASGIGYQGIHNSLAVEFDTFTNADEGDPTFWHVSVHTAGAMPNTAKYSELNEFHRLDKLGDSDKHTVRIALFPGLHTGYLNAGKFSGTKFLSNFLSEGFGTLCVYHDDLDDPLFCIPLNLRSAIATDSGDAFVGLTASTGLHYENHDIFDWSFATT